MKIAAACLFGFVCCTTPLVAQSPSSTSKPSVFVQHAGEDVTGPLLAARVRQGLQRTLQLVPRRADADIVINLLSADRRCGPGDGASAVAVAFFRRADEHYLGSMILIVGVNKIDVMAAVVTRELAAAVARKDAAR